MSKNTIKNAGWEQNRKTSIYRWMKDILEMHFHIETKPSLKTITFLANSLQIKKETVRIWFYNRRHEENRKKVSLTTTARRTRSATRFFTKEDIFKEAIENSKNHIGSALKNSQSSNNLTKGIALKNSRLCPLVLLHRTKTATNIRFAERLIKRSKKIGNRSRMDIYAVPLIKTTGYPSDFERFSFGNSKCQAEHRTILVMGTKISSQAKFVNGIINFIFDVEQEDKFRFQLIEENYEQTSNISVYEIYYVKGFRVNYSLTFVITPSFSNSKNFEFFRHQTIGYVFQNFFEDKNGIYELDMICHVNMRSSNNQSALSIFGKDVWESISNWKPFNYLDDTCKRQNIPQRFFVELAKMKKKSLSLTKQVLTERKQMEEMLYKLEVLLKFGHGKIKEMQGLNFITKFCKTLIKCNCDAKNFSVVELMQKAKFPASEYNSNCSLQNPFIKKKNERSYSFNSSHPSEVRAKYSCSCYLKKCNIGFHPPHPWSSVKNKSSILSDDTNQRNAVEVKWIKPKSHERIKELQNDLFENGMDMLKYFLSIWQSIKWQNNTALNGTSLLTPRVFDSLFNAEQQLKELGFQFEKFMMHQPSDLQ